MAVTKRNRSGLFDMVLRSANEVIDRIYAPSLDDAKDMYRIRKQMDINTFTKMFDVRHSPQRKR